MKFMKLGTRPDIFFISDDGVRSVCTEVSTDLMIQVDNCRFLLHKFPLLSKCSRLQRLCSEAADCSSPSSSGGDGGRAVLLPDFPGGAEAFETCAKFCYGITVTLSPLNIVSVRCAAEYLQMTDDLDRGNLVGKLEIFLNSCILRRWKDSLVTLQSTREFPRWSEELGITGRCIEAVSFIILGNPSRVNWSQSSQKSMSSRGWWWGEDLSELVIDHFWRIMIAVRSSGRVSDKLVGKALKAYAYRWLPNMSRDHRTRELQENSCSESTRQIALKHRLLLERIVSLLPPEKGSVSCSFLLKLLKAANILSASSTSKMELARRAGVQLEEATVADLLIPSLSCTSETFYDVDVVTTILEEFMLQGQSPPTSPPRDKLAFEEGGRRRSRSAENLDSMGQECGRRFSSSSASHGAKLMVAKLIDGFLQEVARDANLPIVKLMALAEGVPDFARPDHDDLYRVVDTYLKAHPDLDKSERKRLCRILNCKKLSVQACMHAAQNELLPLRVVVQVLFFDQARAATTGAHVKELPGNIKALLASAAAKPHENGGSTEPPIHVSTTAPSNDDWMSISSIKSQKQKLTTTTTTTTLRMQLEQTDHDVDDSFVQRGGGGGGGGGGGLERTTSSRFKALCSIPNKPKRMLSKFWTMSRSSSERH